MNKERDVLLACFMCLVVPSHLTPCELLDCSPPGSSVPGGKNTGVCSPSLLQGNLLNTGMKPRHPLQVDSLPSEPAGKPKKRILKNEFFSVGMTFWEM